MGNCQVVDTASLIIQHPNGKVDRIYWPVNAGEIMKSNPGHYVALLISTKICSSEITAGHRQTNSANFQSVRLTRIKLLKPTDSLVLGQIYRLVTTRDVLQGLKAKQEEKVKRNLLDVEGKMGNLEKGSEGEMINHGMKYERNRVKKNQIQQCPHWQNREAGNHLCKVFLRLEVEDLPFLFKNMI